MSIKVPEPKFSRFAEARFECSNGHTTRKWCWSDLYEVPCGTCEASASRMLPKRLRAAQGVTPMTYAINPATNEIWVPGDPSKKPPKGYVSREVRTWRERDLFYRERRAKADIDHQEFALGHEHEFGSLVKDGEDTLRRYLAEDHVPEIDRVTNQPTGRSVRLTPDGRQFIRFALEREGYRQPEWRGAEASIAAWEEDHAESRRA